MKDSPAVRLDAPFQERTPEEETVTWIIRFARFGYICKGLVYFVLGILAAHASLTIERAPGTESALQAIATRRFGQFLLSIVAFGLAGYILWRLVMALKDPERKGNSLRGIANRMGYLGSAIAYGTIAFTAVEIILSGRSTSGGSPSDLTAWVLRLPAGDWLLGIAGLVLLGIATEEMVRGYRASFLEYCDLSLLGRIAGKWVARFGQIGLLARGALYGVVGGLLIQAALEYDPTDIEGLGSALRWVEQQAFGSLILAVTAVGLLAYGIFAIAEGYCRQIARNEILDD